MPDELSVFQYDEASLVTLTDGRPPPTDEINSFRKNYHLRGRIPRTAEALLTISTVSPRTILEGIDRDGTYRIDKF